MHISKYLKFNRLIRGRGSKSIFEGRILLFLLSWIKEKQSILEAWKNWVYFVRAILFFCSCEWSDCEVYDANFRWLGAILYSIPPLVSSVYLIIPVLKLQVCLSRKGSLLGSHFGKIPIKPSYPQPLCFNQNFSL